MIATTEIAFFGKLRDAGSSLVMTIPNEVVEQLRLKAGRAYQFKVNAELSSPEPEKEVGK